MESINLVEKSSTGIYNLNMASGNVQIPSGLPIGTKLTYRKISSLAGAITISTQGSEKITSSSLSSISLASDGDYWNIEKISDTRWDLLDGRETGTNVNGSYSRNANGLQICENRKSSIVSAAYTTGSIYVTAMSLGTFAKPFISVPRLIKSLDDTTIPYLIIGTEIVPHTELLAGNLSLNRATTFSNVSVTVSYIAEGRWY